jgi:hypothetical protein
VNRSRRSETNKESVLYQITKLSVSPDESPTVIAITSKSSAQRLIAALGEQGELNRAHYRVTRFSHSELPLMEAWGRKARTGAFKS